MTKQIDLPDWKYNTEGIEWDLDIQLKRRKLDLEICGMHNDWYDRHPTHSNEIQKAQASKKGRVRYINIQNDIFKLEKTLKQCQNKNSQ